MTARNGFLNAIREEPGDLTHRLVFADWLDEQGDPLGELIRVQHELESYEGDYWGKAACALREREEELLRNDRKKWPKPLLRLDEKDPYFAARYRRGLIEHLTLSLPTFVEQGATVLEHCPALHSLAFFGAQGNCSLLTNCKELRAIRHLELTGWITDEDAEALASSLGLEGLRSLAIWLGSRRYQQSVCRILSGESALKSLERLELIQICGGGTIDFDESANGEADAIAREVNQARGNGFARVIRPFERLFALNGTEIGYGYYAGKLWGKQPALCWLGSSGHLVVVIFDEHGAMAEEREIEVPDPVARLEMDRFEDDNEAKWIAYLRSEVGLEPGVIFVREFESSDSSLYQFPSYCFEILCDPDDPNGYLETDDLVDTLYRWKEDGDFVLDSGYNDYYVGPDGTVQSS